MSIQEPSWYSGEPEDNVAYDLSGWPPPSIGDAQTARCWKCLRGNHVAGMCMVCKEYGGEGEDGKNVAGS